MQRKTRHFRYSIYSIKDGGEKRARGISELRGQESSPWTHKSFVCKRRLISQAGRREFEDWLPLHKINSLQNTPESVLRLCSVNLSIAANRLKMGVLFTSHRAPVSGLRGGYDNGRLFIYFRVASGPRLSARLETGALETICRPNGATSGWRQTRRISIPYVLVENPANLFTRSLYR